MKKPGPKPKARPRPGAPGWAQRLGAARAAAGLTQKALAGLIGKTQTAITDYEKGSTEPDLSTFHALAAALKVSPFWLVFGEERESDALTAAAGDEHHRLFPWVFHETANMLAEQGLQADLAFIATYARKFLRAVEGGANDLQAKEILRAAISEERTKIRQRLDKVRQDLI